MTWVAHDIRDGVVDFIAHWSALPELSARRLVIWLGLSPRKFSRWRARYGKANEHNALVPRDHWLEEWEKEAIKAFFSQYPLEGHRRLAFMLLDRDLVAVSPSSVYRVLKEAGLLYDRFQQPSRKGKGFVQPLKPHDHWHIDFSYINIAATFYYLCTVLDGCSRYVVAWDLRISMTEADAEIVLQRGRESFPGARPQIISDNGSQFIARDFKEFIRLWQTSHVFTSPHYATDAGFLSGKTEVVAALRAEASSPDPERVQRAVRLLLKLGDEQTVRETLAICQHDSDIARRWGARSNLKQSKHPAVIEQLIPVVQAHEWQPTLPPENRVTCLTQVIAAKRLKSSFRSFAPARHFQNASTLGR